MIDVILFVVGFIVVAAAHRAYVYWQCARSALEKYRKHDRYLIRQGLLDDISKAQTLLHDEGHFPNAYTLSGQLLVLEERIKKTEAAFVPGPAMGLVIELINDLYTKQARDIDYHGLSKRFDQFLWREWNGELPLEYCFGAAPALMRFFVKRRFKSLAPQTQK